MTGNTAHLGYFRFLSSPILFGGWLSDVIHCISGVFAEKSGGLARRQCPVVSIGVHLGLAVTDAHPDAQVGPSPTVYGHGKEGL